ncbi:MAG TPA: OB-fold nucleic acid binding domain-containing protein, partial [Gammaproteobacteria bacterium]|nr:OB-fold nucleic acid binding domain-containing protein [Gammaproteobacteria bacterium]
RFVTHTLHALPTRECKVVVAGIINQIRTLQTKRGERMAFVTLDDNTGTFEIAIFADLYQKRRDFLNKDDIVIVSGLLSVNAQQIRLRAEDILDLPHAREKYAARLRLIIKSSPQIDFENWIQGLQQVLGEEKGHCRIAVDYCQDNFHARLHLGKQWGVLPSDNLINKLKECSEHIGLHMDYV